MFKLMLLLQSDKFKVIVKLDDVLKTALSLFKSFMLYFITALNSKSVSDFCSLSLHVSALLGNCSCPALFCQHA